MTKREGAIISAFSGILCGNFASLQEYADEVMGYPTFTHQFGNKKFVDKLKEKSRNDFIELCNEQV